MSTRTLIVALSLSCAALVAGCYRPQGPLLNYTGAARTYYSTETQPKTVRIVDLRTQEVIFSMDIPAGKQLTLDFVAEAGDDPVYTPDLMRYMVFDLGTPAGTLQNTMSVPAQASMRIDVSLRPGPEYVTASPDRALRTDEEGDREDWWTPKGGEMNEDHKALQKYDK